MKNITMKLKEAVDKGMTRFYEENPLKVCSLALTWVVVIFAGQSCLLANVSDISENQSSYCIPVSELFQWVDEGMDQKSKEFLVERSKRYLQDMQEFEAYKDLDSEDYRTLVGKIAPVMYEGCYKDLEKVEGNAYMKAFLKFYRPNSEKYQSLRIEQQKFIDMLYSCFAL